MADVREKELFERVKAGERRAFALLKEALNSPVRRFIHRLVGYTPSEDDIAQEVFLSLHLNLNRIQTVEHLRPFVFRVVRLRCYDELRRRGRFKVVSLDDDPDRTELPILADGRPPPDEEIQRMFLLAEVRRAIDRLPELHRQTLILYAEEDFSYEQIATAMATDIGTVKSRLHYARKNLQKLLKPEVLEAMGVHRKSIS